MKKILYTLAIAALALASCSKEAIEKADVEAGFAAKKELPTVKIVSVGDYNKLDDFLPVQVSFSGVAGHENVSMGVLVSTDPTFTSSNFIKAEAQADGTYTINVKGAAKQTNYFAGVAATADGTGLSETKSFDFPDVAWFKKIPGTYKAAGVLDSWYGDEYELVLTVILDEEDPEHKAIVADLDPYFVGKYGYSYAAKGVNYVEVTIDEETHTLVAEGGQAVKVGPYSFFGLTENDEIVFQISEDGKTMTIADGYVVVDPDDEEDVDVLFEGPIVLKK